jgi:hypothetical protein
MRRRKPVAAQASKITRTLPIKAAARRTARRSKAAHYFFPALDVAKMRQILNIPAL